MLTYILLAMLRTTRNASGMLSIHLHRRCQGFLLANDDKIQFYFFKSISFIVSIRMTYHQLPRKMFLPVVIEQIRINCKMLDSRLSTKAEKIYGYADTNNLKWFCENRNTFYGPESFGVSALMSIGGTLLL